ncbi:hypothetical protein GCM10010377_80900 [Streptomyces viridiviolaceus]|uniref:Uncharacterized protein n=1 Tax=Streptomyces viridiviolaceus TaxID=68282 RepID=A0ABW2EAW4_9ACTN|nr:hypothetical protein [Streptomyces viridiviolaceus]GHB78655.1 hypothetical protein GCM10010377_80900 [Streptomyces viridiviolaceus]
MTQIWTPGEDAAEHGFVAYRGLYVSGIDDPTDDRLHGRVHLPWQVSVFIQGLSQRNLPTLIASPAAGNTGTAAIGGNDHGPLGATPPLAGRGTDLGLSALNDRR